MINSADLISLMMLNTLGMSILTETLRSASSANFANLYLSGPESEQCYLFVQGTGLDILIDTYDLGYEPGRLRMTFNYCYRISHAKENGSQLHNLSSSGASS